MVSQSNMLISSMTPGATPALPTSATAADTASVSNSTPAPAPAQGGFWNDIKNLPGQAINAVTKIPVVGKAIGTAMSWANKPLQEIQKDYKFIHSLYADHGFGAGLLGTLGVVAGGVIGTLGGPEGTVIGADLAGAAVRNIMGRVVPTYQDSFNKSNDPKYLVSFGRDLAHALSNVPGFGTLANTNTGMGQVVSGVADASFDFESDPLATFGKLKGAVKRGDNVAVATETDAITNVTKVKLDPDTGKPIARAAMPFATSGGALQNFLLSNSLVVHSADQLDMALGSVTAGPVNRAIADIVDKAVNSPKTAAADIANTYGVKNGWSRAMSVALSKVSNADQVTQIFKQALYSKELADSSTEALGALKLPTKSVGKLLSEKIGVERIKKSEQGSTFNDQVNLLVPRKSAVMEPVTDEAGNVTMQPKTVTRMDAQGNRTSEQVFKLNKPAIFAPGDAMNALAAKVRTFTGRRPLSFDKEEMALSSKQVDMSDPNLGQTIYDIAYLSMPHRLALEHSSAFLTASSDTERLAMLHTLHQEVLKNFGIADAQATPLFSQLKDASVGSEADHGVYAKLDGGDVGTVEVKPEYGSNPKSMGIVIGHAYKGAMLDLKDIRQQLRSAKAYGALYNPVDDFFTMYTNVIFAPLALLSPAFGLRVSVGESLHQVMRRGLPSYISNVLAVTLKGMDDKYKLYHADKIAQGLTEADKTAIELEQAQRFYSASKEYYYRETSPYGLEDLIRTSIHEPFWFAKNKDLALGQGANKGVMLHFDIENHRATAGEGSYIGSKKVREFEGRNARKDAMNFQGDSSERSLLLNGKDAINSIDRIDFSAEQWQYLKKSKPSTLDNYKRTFIDKYNYTLRENADNSASFIREKQPARVTETEVTKELNAKEQAVKGAYDAANGERTAKQNFDASRFHPDSVQAARDGASDYAEQAGIKQDNTIDYKNLKADKARAAKIAEEYNKLPVMSEAAKPKYDALAAEVKQQFDYMTNKLGVQVEFVDADPYKNSKEMMADVSQGRLKVLKTSTTGPHPYFTNEQNDMFRAVHDYFGHAATGRGFGQDGEEAAWAHHSQMFSTDARAALTTETRGQNSWFHNNGKKFAEQKTAILPDEYHQVPSDVARVEKQTIKSAPTSKAAWNAAVNKVSDTRHTLMPMGWVAGKFLKSNLSTYLVKDKIRLMDEYQDVLGNRGPTAGVASAHQASQEMSAKDQIDMFTKTRGHGMVPGQELAGLTQFDPHFHDYAAKNINMAARDEAQRDIARAYLKASKNPAFKNMSVQDQFASLVDGQAANIRNLNMYKDYRNVLDGYTKAVPESFAKAQIDYLHGIVKGANGVVNMDLVGKIAKGEQVTGKELRQRPVEQMPVSVLGRRAQPRMSDALRQVEEKGYRTFVNPVMDYVSRQPLFNDFYARRRMANEPLIQMGLMSRDEAVRLSAIQATKEMIPAIHSPAIRSQFAVIHRNLLPFFFAQEQAMRRTGRLILTNPQAFRDFQIIQQGLNNPGFVHTDANGQKYIVYPGLGEAGNAISRGLNALGLSQFSGLPTSVTGNTASLLTVLPEMKMPGTSPFINLALGDLAKKFPWMDKAVNVASGGYPAQNMIDTLIPSATMRDLFNGMTMSDKESTVYNSKLSAIMAAYYHGDLPSNFTSLPAFQQQTILTKIEHNAQSNLIIKGLFAFFLPLAPTVSNDYYNKQMQSLRSEYIGLLNATDPATGAKYTAASALNKFIADNGERALSYTVAHTASGSGNAYAPLADSTVTWINNNQPILSNNAYSTAAPYLIPQVGDSKDALSVENKLLVNHFRAKVSPKDFINSLYVKSGWQDLSDAYSGYQADIAQLRKNNDKNGMYQAGQQWKSIAATYGQSNPIWYADYMNPTKLETAAVAIKQFAVMQDKGMLNASTQGQKISTILDNYKLYHQDLIANTYNGKHLPGYGQAMDAWYSYMDNLAASDPQLSSVITGVFRRAV